MNTNTLEITADKFTKLSDKCFKFTPTIFVEIDGRRCQGLDRGLIFQDFHAYLSFALDQFKEKIAYIHNIVPNASIKFWLEGQVGEGADKKLPQFLKCNGAAVPMHGGTLSLIATLDNDKLIGGAIWTKAA